MTTLKAPQSRKEEKSAAALPCVQHILASGDELIMLKQSDV